MAARTRSAERREKPLSRERIVEAAVTMLDAEGESGLTFRGLARSLSTGPGAIYWHVTGKRELLDAATESVIAGTLPTADPHTAPDEAIRTLALGVFDAIDDHPWIGRQLAHGPTRSPMLQVFEHLGRQVRALEVPGAAQFTAVSALLNYILGVGEQNAANARSAQPGTGRTEFLHTTADTWATLDPEEYPFTRNIAERLRGHNDREEFLAGLDYLLTGITTTHRADP